MNIVHNKELHDNALGVFLSGNGPLVRVLTEALARDCRERESISLKQAYQKVSTFIQNVHRFIDAHYADSASVPPDRVVVFDEAQRAWNAEQSARKFKRPASEPKMMLDVMNRHEGWAAIVALVGVGQEINTGEAGLAEWGRALATMDPPWTIAVSPDLAHDTHAGLGLSQAPVAQALVRQNNALHLHVTLRSPKSEGLSRFIDAVLDQRRDEARAMSNDVLRAFPIVLTRSLNSAKQWLRSKQRGTRRIGLVASSGARRLRAHGIDVTADLDVENWFLNGPNDVRSSHCLEVPATEFGIQGLELDWVGVCWGSDLSPADSGWRIRKFRGTEWQSVKKPESRRYVINKYRVLLTRAREGVVIWVPTGNADDRTRPPSIYNSVADFLIDCGIANLDSPAH